MAGRNLADRAVEFFAPAAGLRRAAARAALIDIAREVVINNDLGALTRLIPAPGRSVGSRLVPITPVRAKMLRCA